MKPLKKNVLILVVLSLVLVTGMTFATGCTGNSPVTTTETVQLTKTVTQTQTITVTETKTVTIPTLNNEEAIVQVWESEELVATGVVVGDGSQVLTILNYEVDAPDSLDLTVVAPSGG